IPNDITVYFGLRYAKELGLKTIMTGDGADELFAGYDYMKDVLNLEEYIQRLSKRMYFSSNQMADALGLKLRQPYLDRQFLDFAVNKIPVELKLKKVNGTFWGKWILRKAFEDALPKEIIWQSKRPLEYGSGMNRLRQVISDKVFDEEFKGNTAPISFINKEHFYYYKIYKEVVGEIPKPKINEKECSGCGAGMQKDGFHCKVCGHVLDWRT
ncbi:MAG: hypothetical protein KJ923_04035, partial [Candidatus Omnitrophica bacterium]|nr:hypothetical protein [Candidatus Omnitrophota bacterium]